MDCILMTAIKSAKSEIVAVINGDIMIFQGFMESVKLVASRYDNFFLVGRRHKGYDVPLLETHQMRKA